MDEPEPQERRPIPLIIWVGLGVLAVLAFVIAMRVASPPGAGGSPTADMIVPNSPKPADLPDAKPLN